MPLLVMVGGPCSGKSTRAKQVRDYLASVHQQDVQIVSEELLDLNKQTYLQDPTKEKILRACLKSNTEKYLSSDRIVILDAMNYIKGFRYELYCLARNAQTTLCLLYCDSDLDVCQQICEKQDYENPHPPHLFTDYAQRMETPDPAKRWDKPLFIVRQNEEAPFEQIAKALMEGSKPRDPVSTKPEVDNGQDFVFLLDKHCQAVLTFIQQSGQQVGDTLTGVPGSSAKSNYKVVKVLSVLELKRLKKEFLSLAKMHPPKVEHIADAFLEFLNTRNQE